LGRHAATARCPSRPSHRRRRVGERRSRRGLVRPAHQTSRFRTPCCLFRPSGHRPAPTAVCSVIDEPRLRRHTTAAEKILYSTCCRLGVEGRRTGACKSQRRRVEWPPTKQTATVESDYRCDCRIDAIQSVPRAHHRRSAMQRPPITALVQSQLLQVFHTTPLISHQRATTNTTTRLIDRRA
jgi:hypothetical protein